jgi:hypothetical protein
LPSPLAAVHFQSLCAIAVPANSHFGSNLTELSIKLV